MRVERRRSTGILQEPQGTPAIASDDELLHNHIWDKCHVVLSCSAMLHLLREQGIKGVMMKVKLEEGEKYKQCKLVILV
jgi:hypothetical protein